MDILKNVHFKLDSILIKPVRKYCSETWVLGYRNRNVALGLVYWAKCIRIL